MKILKYQAGTPNGGSFKFKTYDQMLEEAKQTQIASTPTRSKEVEYNNEGDYYEGGTPFSLTLTKTKPKENKSSWRWTTVSNPRMRQLTASDAMKAAHTAVNPILAFTSPSQYYGAFRDSKNVGDWFRSMMRGNSGFVTKEFEQEHPFISMGLNLTGDVAGTAAALKYAPKIGEGFRYAWESIPRRTASSNKSNLISSRSFGAEEVVPENSKTVLGPNDWLQNWFRTNPGKEVTLTESKLSQLFDSTKEDVRKYIFGDEFKQRVMNSGKFTEDEYNDLTKALEERLNQTTFSGLQNRKGAENFFTYLTGNKTILPERGFKVTAYPTHSNAQHRANMWHELWHSLGGRGIATDPNPLIQRLSNYNQSINPTQKSRMLKHVEDLSQSASDSNLSREESMFQRLKPVNENVDEDVLNNFIGEELRVRDWLSDEILSKNHEVRSRMHAVLDRFRQLGYDTKELIGSPQKFIDWVNELKDNRVIIPWDLQHLLQSYDIKDLSNYASKMLSTTGGMYLGGKYLNQYGNNNTQRR